MYEFIKQEIKQMISWNTILDKKKQKEAKLEKAFSVSKIEN